MKNNSFDAISYFKSKMTCNKTDKIILSLYRSKLNSKIKKKLKTHINTENLKYVTYINLNKRFIEYLDGFVHNNIFVEKLYKTELAGAMVTIRDISAPLLSFDNCIVVEERVNSIVAISPSNKVRVFPKERIEMILNYKNQKYLIIGEFLKSNRFYKN